MSYTGEVVLEVVANRLSGYCEVKGLIPEEQCGLAGTLNHRYMFVVSRLQ